MSSAAVDLIKKRKRTKTNCQIDCARVISLVPYSLLTQIFFSSEIDSLFSVCDSRFLSLLLANYYFFFSALAYIKCEFIVCDNWTERKKKKLNENLPEK